MVLGQIIGASQVPILIFPVRALQLETIQLQNWFVHRIPIKIQEWTRVINRYVEMFLFLIYWEHTPPIDPC